MNMPSRASPRRTSSEGSRPSRRLAMDECAVSRQDSIMAAASGRTPILVVKRAIASIVLASIAVVSLAAQTAIKLPKNKYTPQQDVELGREAAAEVRQQYPIIKDERITAYLTRMGDRLVEAAPKELKQPVYEYSFTPVNLKEINAFALPGGPMFIHRGLVDVATSEAELAGVM